MAIMAAHPKSISIDQRIQATGLRGRLCAICAIGQSCRSDDTLFFIASLDSRPGLRAQGVREG